MDRRKMSKKGIRKCFHLTFHFHITKYLWITEIIFLWKYYWNSTTICANVINSPLRKTRCRHPPWWNLYSENVTFQTKNAHAIGPFSESSMNVIFFRHEFVASLLFYMLDLNRDFILNWRIFSEFFVEISIQMHFRQF